MAEYKKCLDCGEINSTSSLTGDFLTDRCLTIRLHCPVCGFDRFQEVEAICNDSGQ